MALPKRAAPCRLCGNEHTVRIGRHNTALCRDCFSGCQAEAAHDWAEAGKRGLPGMPEVQRKASQLLAEGVRLS